MAVALLVTIPVVLVMLITLSKADGVLRLGRALVLLSVLSLPWSAIQIAGVPLGDLPLVLSIPLLLIAAVEVRFQVPAAVWVGAGLVGVAALLTAFRPPSAAYLSSRYVLDQSFTLSLGIAPRSSGNLITAVKFELAILVLPIVLMLACAHGGGFARKIGASWVTGIVLSCAIGYTDSLGITHVSQALLGYTNLGGRQSGLTPQPNNVGVEAAMAIPLLLFFVSTSRARARSLAILGIAVCLAGVYISGSRGAAIGVPAAFLLSFFLAPPRLRRLTRRVLLIAGTSLVLVLLSPFGERLLIGLRLSGGNTDVAQSDESRFSSRGQGIADFLHSPIHGIGWGYSSDAHIIYLQLLAAGGLLGGVAALVLVGGVAQLTLRHVRPIEPYAGALLASVFSWLIIGIVENQLTDQWLWVPLGSLVGLVSLQRSGGLADSSELVLDAAAEGSAAVDVRRGDGYSGPVGVLTRRRPRPGPGRTWRQRADLPPAWAAVLAYRRPVPGAGQGTVQHDHSAAAVVACPVRRPLPGPGFGSNCHGDRLATPAAESAGRRPKPGLVNDRSGDRSARPVALLTGRRPIPGPGLRPHRRGDRMQVSVGRRPKPGPGRPAGQKLDRAVGLASGRRPKPGAGRAAVEAPAGPTPVN